MTRRLRKDRFTTTPSRMEVDVRAIPLLPPGGWKLCTSKEMALVGAAPKNYLAYGNPLSPETPGYIAKKGRLKADARECVTEEIISKIGSMLPLEIASSKLVRVSKHDVRFLSRNFIVPGQHTLVHGIELMARYFQTNSAEVESAFELRDREQEHNFYTVNNILTVLMSLYPEEKGPLREGFFRMLAFDAFIGAPDRHGMNWGVIEPLVNSRSIRFSPIYDTARGLFREYSDTDLIEKAQQRGRERFLEDYANRSKPIFSTGRGKTDNHFSLMKWISEQYPHACRNTICKVFNAIDIPPIERMLQRRFRRIITQDRIGFIRDLLLFRINRLRKEVQV